MEITINQTALSVKEYRGNRVVTFKDIDAVHGRPDGTASRNFRTNKQHFLEGEDYYKITPDEFRRTIGEMDSRQQNDVTLVTESGYLMLVKSFTDELAWKVQRQLVKSYFRAKELASEQIERAKLRRIEVQEQNAKTRAAKLLMKMAEVDTLSQAYKSILVSKAAEVLTGTPVLPLPKTEQKTYSAKEISSMFGVSPQKIGKIANEHGLKTDEYGAWYRDKSPYSSKEVDTFRYNDNAVEMFRKLLGNDAE